MTTDRPDSKNPSMPPEEDPEFDTLFDHLTEQSLRPPPKTRSSVPAPNVSLQPAALVSGVVAQGQSNAPRDAGAEAARRTVRKRAGRRGLLPLVGRGPEVIRARAALLAHMAQRASGPRAARLWTAAADFHMQLDERDVACALWDRASSPSAMDIYGLRASQRDANEREEWARLVALLSAEAALDLPPIERAVALTRAAEVELIHQADPARASELCQQALGVDPSTVAAALLWITASRQLADRKAEAAAYRALAHSWKDSHGRVAAHTLSAHAHEAIGEAENAYAAFATALGERGSWTDAAFGMLRTCRAASDPTGAATAVARYARGVDDAEARSLWLRAAARVAASFAKDPALAQEILVETTSRLGVRLAARIAATGTDLSAYRATLERWAQVSGGSERAVALVELARLALDVSDYDAAEQALVDAAIADGNLGTVRVLREVLARRRGDTSGLANYVTDNEDEVLTSAAKLAVDRSHAVQERALLRRASRQGDDALTADVVALDAAAEAGDREAVFAGVSRRAARARPEDRVGPLLALLDYLPADEWGPRRSEVETELGVSAPDSTLALRQRARVQPDLAQRAGLFYVEAERAHGDHAAFCATLAGDLLAATEQDPTQAYRLAALRTPTYEPGAWALERCARAAEDAPLLLDLQDRLAQQARMPAERAARLLRAGLLHASASPDAAQERLKRALTERPGDPIITELLLRLSAGKADSELADLLLASAAQAGPEVALAARMRAGALMADVGDWTAAAKHYRIAVELSGPTDAFAIMELDRAELLAGEQARVAQRRTDAVREAEDVASQAVALSNLAEFERDRGDLSSAVMAWQSLSEVSPYNVQTLRTLERYYFEHQREEEIAFNSEVLIDALADPRDVATYLRLALAATAKEQLAERDRALADNAGQTAGDAWVMRAEAAAAVRAGDAERAWRAIHELISHLSDPMERASLCMRALDGAGEGTPAALAALLGSAVNAVPQHPLASEELARLLESASDHAGAAQAFEIAARAAFSTERKVSLWYRAGVLWHDKATDNDRALAALREAAALQMLHRDTFQRLHLLLSTRGDTKALGDLIEQRIALGGDASLLSSLHGELSSLRGELQDRAGAKAGLRAALTLDETNIGNWHALAELQLADEEWSAAAESLIQLARLSKDQPELRWAFFTLGDLYETKIPDLKRAEIAFSRAIKLAPDDTAPIERVAKVFEAQGQFDMAERALKRLSDLTVAEVERWTGTQVDLARVITKAGSSRRGEEVLEAAHRKSPLELVLNRALEEHHRGQNDESARAMHLARAIASYRTAIAANVANADAWTGLVDMLERRGKRDAADLCARVATLLDVEAPALRDRKQPAPVSAAVLSADVDDLIAPAGLTPSTRVVLRQLGPVLEKLLAIDTRGPGAERLKTRAESVQRPLQLASTWIGVDRVEVYVNRTRSCHVSDTNPWSLAIGDALMTGATEAEKLFLFARALKLAASDLVVAVRTDTLVFGGALHGLLRLVDPSYEPAGVDVAAMEEWAKRLGRAIPRRLFDEVAPNVLEMSGSVQGDLTRLGQICDRFGARLALVATGDIAAGVAALLREADLTVGVGDPREVQQGIARHPVAADLLTFALSDECFAAREIALFFRADGTAPSVSRPGH